MTTDGVPYPKTIDLTIANRSCHPDAEGLTCNITLPLLNGRHTMALDVYDAPVNTGKLLAHSNDTYVSDAIPSHAINVYLHGIAAAVSVTADAGESGAGNPVDITIHIIAKDADGYPILNGAEYDLPILLTMNTAGSSTLSRTTITAARHPVVLHYDGTATEEIVVTAIVPGVASARLVLPVRR